MAWGKQTAASDLAQLVGLVRNPTTKNLVVMPNRKLDSSSASALADEVAKAPALESIVVASATLGPDAAAALVRAAFACPTVSKLNLSFPALGDEELMPLLAEVKKAGTAEGAGTGLSSMELLLPLATEAGAIALADALKPAEGCAPAVRGLHLTRMQVGRAGLRALGDAVGAGGLLHLKLDGCGHFDHGAAELAGLSAPGSALESLHLTGMKLRPVAPEEEEEQPAGDVKQVGRSAPPTGAALPPATRSPPPVSAADAEPATEAELAALRGLGALPSLKTLRLVGAGLDEACGRAIAQGVAARAEAAGELVGEGAGPLLQLVLDHNPLGDAGAAAVIEELRPGGPAATAAAAAGAAAGAGADAGAGAGAPTDDEDAAVLTAEAAARWGLGVSLTLLVTGAAGATARAAASVWTAQVAAALAGGAKGGVLFRAVDMGANRGVGEAAMSGLIKAGGRALGQVGVMGNVEFETANDGTEEGVGVLGAAVGEAMRHFHALLPKGSTVTPDLRLPRGSAGLTGPGVDLSMLYLGPGGCTRVIGAVAEAVGATAESDEGKAATALAAAAEAAGSAAKASKEEPRVINMSDGVEPPTVSTGVLHHSLLHADKPLVLGVEASDHLGTQGRHVYLLLAGNDLGAEGRTVGLRLVKWLHLFG